MGRLQGKVAIITGGASGMGEAAVKRFIEEGAKVVATDVNEEGLEQLVNDIGKTENLVTQTHDVADESDWDNVVELALNEFGKIDVLVNNAGIHIPNDILAAEIDDWNQVINVNLNGVWLGMKKVIPKMQDNGSGSIVNCSSIAGLAGGVTANGGGAAYSASKGGVIALSKHAAADYGKDNIRVNTVHPGPIFTGLAKNAGITSQEEMGSNYTKSVLLPPYAGESDDIANAYLYLASDESKFVTGLELLVDGGSLAH